MLSEAMLNRAHDVSPTSTPTAPKKVFDMDTSQKDTSEYKKKPMAQWTYDDVVQFFLDSKWSLQSTGKNNFIFSAISGATGRDLMHFERSRFLAFSPKYGDEIYEYMQHRVATEMELDRAGVIHHNVHPHRSPTLHSPSNTPYNLSPSSLTSPTTTHHSHHPQPSIICDAPARYEFRFEPAPSHPTPHPRFQVGGGLGGAGEAYSAPPSASKKSFSLLPPLLAMEGGREREERRERVNGDAGPGDVRSGEQGRSAEEEVKVEPPKKRGPGRPRKPENELKKRKKKTGRLWEFIRNLLLDPETCPSLVKWENAEEGLFRFVDAEKVARKWGDRKQNNDMNYEKLSRAMRYYYKTHIFEAVIGRRLVYKFGKNAKGWRPSNPNFPDINRNLATHRDPPPPPQPPPTHHHSDPTPQIHLHTDPTPQIHLHSDLTQAIPHHSDSTPSLHHQVDSKPSTHHQMDATPSLHHQREAKLSLHHHLDSTLLLHHHTDDTSSLHHHGDSKPSIHHHMESKAILHHHSDLSSPLHQLESQHHMEYKSDSPPPLSHHRQHHHTLQSLALHHHQLQHPHNTT